MRKKSAFSLMEMMVVLLIVAIIAGASAPMISKNMKDGANAGIGDSNCGWLRVATGTVFNPKKADNKTAMIGKELKENKSNKASSQTWPHLYIHTEKTERPHVELSTKQGSGFLTRTKEFAYWFSSKQPNDKDNPASVAMGHESEAKTNSVAIGHSAKSGNDSISIGIGSNTLDASGSIVMGHGAHTSKSNSIAIGKSATTDGNNSVAIGSLDSQAATSTAKVTKAGKDSIAIGTEASAVDTYMRDIGGKSVAIGYKTKADNSSATAIGTESNASAYSVAIGEIAKAEDYQSVAIGGEAQAKKGGATSIGYNAVADKSMGVAIGASTNASNNYSIAIGGGSIIAITGGTATYRPASSSGTASIAIGTSAQTSLDRDIAIGYSANAMGPNSIALGDNSQVGGVNCLALGAGAKAVAEGNVQASIQNGTAVGAGATARSHSVALGNNATATAWSVALGNNAKTTESESIAIGSYSKASGTGAVAIGHSKDEETGGATAGAGSVAIGGYYSEVKQPASASSNAVAIGSGAIAGSDSIAIGFGAITGVKNSVLSNHSSIAIGNGAEALGSNSVAIGNGAKTKIRNQIVLGTEDSVVYIPGSLVVDHNIVLGRLGSAAYDGNNWGDSIIIRADMHNASGDTWNSRLGRLLINHWRNEDKGQDEENLQHYYEGYQPVEFDKNSLGIYRSISDRRLKNVGEVFKGGLEEIKKLEVFNYVYKKDNDKTPRVGVMAQDLQKIFPNAVFKGDDGFLRIRMDDMFYALVNAVKELDKKIDLLIEKQKEIDTLKAEIKALKNDYSKLEKRLEKLERK